MQEEWKLEFEPRNLKAFSAAPLLVYPTHYTGEEGYISDTEQSQVIEEAMLAVDEPVGPPLLDQKGALDVDFGFNEFNKEEL